MSSVITTVNNKVQRIHDAVTLESCAGDAAEQERKITKLMAVKDPEILNYLLIHHALPYKRYIHPAQKYIDKEETESDDTISFAEFWHRFGELMDYKHRKDSQEGIIFWLLTEAFAIPRSRKGKGEEEEY